MKSNDNNKKNTNDNNNKNINNNNNNLHSQTSIISPLNSHTSFDNHNKTNQPKLYTSNHNTTHNPTHKVVGIY